MSLVKQVSTGAGLFLLQDYNLNSLGRGPLDEVA